MLATGPKVKKAFNLSNFNAQAESNLIVPRGFPVHRIMGSHPSTQRLPGCSLRPGEVHTLQGYAAHTHLYIFGLLYCNSGSANLTLPCHVCLVVVYVAYILFHATGCSRLFGGLCACVLWEVDNSAISLN